MISLEGIDTAISNLNYRNPNTLKSRLLSTVKQYYDSTPVETLSGIPADELITKLWDTGEDARLIKSKRKNLSSIKSSINADLKRLYEAGNNPDGISIGRDNVFVISAEAKDDLLTSFTKGLRSTGAGSIGQMVDVLNAVHEILSNPEGLAADSDLDRDDMARLNQVIKNLSRKFGAESAPAQSIPATPPAGIGEDAESPAPSIEAVQDLERTIETFDQAQVEEEPVTVEVETASEAEETIEEIPPDAEIVDEADLEEAPEFPDAEDLEEAEESETPEEVPQEIEEVQEIAEVVEIEEPQEPLETEGLEDAEEAAPEDTLDEMPPDAEIVDEADLEEADQALVEESLEAIEVEEAPESMEHQEDSPGDLEIIEQDDLEEINEVVSSDDLEGSRIGGCKDDGKVPDSSVLAEDFDHLLGARERSYNEHVLVPAGRYVVGVNNPGEDERPERIIELDPFYIGRFPVTNALFEIFVERTGYKSTAERLGYGTVYFGRYRRVIDEKSGMSKVVYQSGLGRKTIYGACWYQPLGPGSTLHQKRTHPVVQISFEDALAFAAWTGKRLPTEDEWEAAGRSARAFLYPWGNSWKRNVCNVEDSSLGDTSPVDRYMEFSNELGLADMIGNAMEWTMDICDPPFRSKSDLQYHVAKGGSWASNGATTRLTTRFKLGADTHSNILGFRCVAY
ncbi:MAG: SUMF1/EgtB/PvdO family nonheme iron enzyme [Pseudomonadota bacterium]